MAQQVKSPAAKPDGLFHPGGHRVGRELVNFGKLFSDLYTCSVTGTYLYMYTRAHIKKNKYKTHSMRWSPYLILLG